MHFERRAPPVSLFWAGCSRERKCKIKRGSKEIVEVRGEMPIILEMGLERNEAMNEPKATADEVVELLRQLPPRERLRAVIRVLPELEKALPPPAPEQRRSLRGLWRGLDITDEDIDEVRREMWAHFPSEDI